MIPGPGPDEGPDSTSCLKIHAASAHTKGESQSQGVCLALGARLRDRPHPTIGPCDVSAALRLRQTVFGDIT